MVNVIKVGQELDAYANHFEHHTDIPTRDHGIKSIRYVEDPNNLVLSRVKEAFMWLFGDSHITALLYLKEEDGAWWKYSLLWRLRMFKHSFKRDNHLPDTVLGGDIFFWEEHAEYYAKVQPSVGSIVAEFLKNDPTNEYAILIAEEIDRLGKAYHEDLVAKGYYDE